MITTDSRNPGSSLSPVLLWWCILHGKRPWWTQRQVRRFLPLFFPSITNANVQNSLSQLINSDWIVPFGRHRFAPRSDRELSFPVFHDPWDQPWADLFDDLGYPIVQPIWPLAARSITINHVTGKFRPWPMQKQWRARIRTRFRFYRLIVNVFPLPPFLWSMVDVSKNKPIWGWSFETDTPLYKEYRCSPADRPEQRVSVFLQGFGRGIGHLASNALPSSRGGLPIEKLKRVDEATAVYTLGYHLQPWAITLPAPGSDSALLGIHIASPNYANPTHHPHLPSSLRSKSPGPVHWAGVSFWFRRYPDGWHLDNLTWGDIHVRRWQHPDILLRQMDDLQVPPPQNDAIPFPHPQALMNIAIKSDLSPSINACFHRLNRLLLTTTPFHRSTNLQTAETMLEYLLARGRHYGRFALDSFFGPPGSWVSLIGEFTQNQPWVWLLGPRISISPASIDSIATLWNPLLNPVDRFAIDALFHEPIGMNIDADTLTRIDRAFHRFLTHLTIQHLTWGSNDPFPDSTFTILTTRANGILVYHLDGKAYGWIPSDTLSENGWFYRPALFQWIHRQTRRSIGCGDTLILTPLTNALPFHLPAFSPASIEKNGSPR